MLMAEAFIMGESLKKSNPYVYMDRQQKGTKKEPRFTYSGCALCGILLAVTPEAQWSQLSAPDGSSMIKALKGHFPWFKFRHEEEISAWYFRTDVCESHRLTVEQVADLIREMEADATKPEETKKAPSRAKKAGKTAKNLVAV